MDSVSAAKSRDQILFDWHRRALDHVNALWLITLGAPTAENGLAVLSSSCGRRSALATFQRRYQWPRAPSKPLDRDQFWVLRGHRLMSLAFVTGLSACSNLIRSAVSGWQVCALRESLGDALYGSTLSGKDTTLFAPLQSDVSPDFCNALSANDTTGYLSRLGRQLLLYAAQDTFCRDCVRFALPPVAEPDVSPELPVNQDQLSRYIGSLVDEEGSDGR